jgi:quercetin dioxygenase-like cupin family protein
MKKVIAAALTLAVTAAFGGRAGAQPSFKRTILQQHDLSTAGREAVTAIAEFSPGAVAAPHTHPGEEIGYVIEGSIVVEQQGQAPKTVSAGQTFFIPAGTVHGARNEGSQISKVVATYVVEKDKPLATPAAMK